MFYAAKGTSNKYLFSEAFISRYVTIYRTSYDQSKQVIQSIVYEEWSYYVPQTNIIISKVNDIDTNEILKKYTGDVAEETVTADDNMQKSN